MPGLEVSSIVFSSDLRQLITRGCDDTLKSALLSLGLSRFVTILSSVGRPQLSKSCCLRRKPALFVLSDGLCVQSR